MTDSANIDSYTKNLYLVGFMGTGKSAVGRRVATKLGFCYIDVDSSIEEKEGLTITRIFDAKGEVAFRDMERTFIESGHPSESCVVSCGGGLVVPEGMPELLRSKGVLVCLWATPEAIFERTKGQSNRPLLNVPNPLQRIRELLAEREPRYLASGNLVSTTERTLDQVSDAVLRLYRASS